MLWPFLERFFARLELIDTDRRFTPRTRAAAVGLVSALATDDACPPEWCLPLPKMLCGLHPTDPVWPPRDPDPAHREESERLLQAVIAHAKVLREMPVPEFQRTFLRRAGVLEIRDGAWLLRVEREPWDLLLDRFPWSWSWIRLPWMPDSIQVEW